MIERCPHRIKLILCLDDKFVISVRVCPFFLLLGHRPIATLPAPCLARPANPTVEDLSVRKVDDFSKLGHQIGELDVRLLTSQLMADLVGNRRQRAVVIGRSHRNQDQVLAIFQPVDDLFSSFFLPEFREVFFNVLSFQRARFQRILADDVLHYLIIYHRKPSARYRSIRYLETP